MENLSTDRSRHNLRLPRTKGEKLFTLGFGVDATVLLSNAVASQLQQHNVIPLDVAHAFRDVMFWGGHIFLSDLMLKVGGAAHMTFFETENFFKRHSSNEDTSDSLDLTPEAPAAPCVRKLLYIDPAQRQISLPNYPPQSVLYVEDKKILFLLSHPGFIFRFAKAFFSLADRFPAYRPIIADMMIEHGVESLDELITRVGETARVMADINNLYRNGTLEGQVVEYDGSIQDAACQLGGLKRG